ncbi:hypothetical protein C8F01DRAFT_1268467 [Mycena amicta]|nr:hypothetical protein C8F01DRAFT_1268467 [Mycena amicta]
MLIAANLSVDEKNLLQRHYGAQATQPFLPLPESTLSAHNREHRLQLNLFATSGVTPSGQPNGYQPTYRRYLSSSSSATVTQSKNTPIRTIVQNAASLAIDIRVNQYFLDGNHRTALLAAIFYLAENGIVLTSSFFVYRAYTVISARFHRGNESNTLDSTARAYALDRFLRYLRRRTVRRAPDPTYLETLAESVRQLPVIVSRVEAMAIKLRRDQAFWRTLTSAEKVLVKWTFPEFTKGRGKLR